MKLAFIKKTLLSLCQKTKTNLKKGETKNYAYVI